MNYNYLLSVLIQLDEKDRSVIIETMDSDVVNDMIMELLEEVELEESIDP